MCPTSWTIVLLAAVGTKSASPTVGDGGCFLTSRGQQKKIFYFGVAQAFVRAKLNAEIYVKLPDGCGDISGKTVRLNR